MRSFLILMCRLYLQSIIDCSAGSFHSFQTSQCEYCPVNFYQPNFGQIHCIACRNGTVTVENGTISHFDCIKGHKCFANYTLYMYTSHIMIHQFAILKYPCIFVECNPGYMYSFNQSDCVPCPKNTYQPMKGQIQCSQCPQGTMTYRDDRHVYINDCKEGMFIFSNSWI